MQKDEKTIIMSALGVFVLLILAYVICFWGERISKNTVDWGAFGSYVSIGIGMLSIVLIYITYQEQRRANEITRVEQHIITMSNTLISLTEQNFDDIHASYKKFSEHFKVSYCDLSECELNNTRRIWTYYYSFCLSEDIDKEKINSLFRYTKVCLDFIQKDENLSEENKRNRFTELTCILPESMRILLMGWLLSNSETSSLKDYYRLGFFISEESSSPLLKDVIMYICTGESPIKRQSPKIDVYNIEVQDFSEEQFSDTYKRLFHS